MSEHSDYIFRTQLLLMVDATFKNTLFTNFNRLITDEKMIYGNGREEGRKSDLIRLNYIHTHGASYIKLIC